MLSTVGILCLLAVVQAKNVQNIKSYQRRQTYAAPPRYESLNFDIEYPPGFNPSEPVDPSPREPFVEPNRGGTIYTNPIPDNFLGQGAPSSNSHHSNPVFPPPHDYGIPAQHNPVVPSQPVVPPQRDPVSPPQYESMNFGIEYPPGYNPSEPVGPPAREPFVEPDRGGSIYTNPIPDNFLGNPTHGTPSSNSHHSNPVGPPRHGPVIPPESSPVGPPQRQPFVEPDRGGSIYTNPIPDNLLNNPLRRRNIPVRRRYDPHIDLDDLPEGYPVRPSEDITDVGRPTRKPFEEPDQNYPSNPITDDILNDLFGRP